MPAVPVPYTAEQDGLKHAADARNFASQKVQKGLTSCPSVQICPQKEAQLVVESPGPDMSSHMAVLYKTFFPFLRPMSI